jgi:hypothetical protein
VSRESGAQGLLFDEENRQTCPVEHSIVQIFWQLFTFLKAKKIYHEFPE